MKIIQHSTYYEDGDVKQEDLTLACQKDDGIQERYLLNLYPEIQYQTVEGFGGAITDAVCYVLEQMPKEKALEVLRSCFSEQGNCYNMIRTPIDSCDFSREPYCALTEDGEFSFTYVENHIIPWIKEAYSMAGQRLPVMLSPWSPPAFMKTNGDRNNGGRLMKKYYKQWAEYLCRYVKEYRARGILVTALSIQNEPNAIQTWDSCLFSSKEEKEFLHEYLSPVLKEENITDLDIYIWDHNKERLFDRALSEISQETDSEIAGLAFHWYSGDHFDAIRLVHERFPDKKLILSEGCIEYSRYGNDQIENANLYAHDLIGDLTSGMNAFFDWNICLNEDGGPNYADNYCEAPIFCDLRNNTIDYKLSYYYIGQFSKYVKPGARRIATTIFNSMIETVAFQNPDNSLVDIIYNPTNSEHKVVLRYDGSLIPLKMKAKTLSTVVIS